MNIQQFNNLLQARRPGAVARVPNNFNHKRRTAVDVVYSPGGKVYTYRGFIYEVAEQLNLIEKPDMNTTARRINAALATQDSVIDFAGASDTCRYFGTDVISADAGNDEYGRKLSEYRKYGYQANGW
jgi:hypothetical protein